jgi:hypothetical protein
MKTLSEKPLMVELEEVILVQKNMVNPMVELLKKVIMLKSMSRGLKKRKKIRRDRKNKMQISKSSFRKLSEAWLRESRGSRKKNSDY